VADALAQRGLQVLITGTHDEAEDAAAVVSAAQTPIINLVGRTSLGALAVLLSQARLLVSNDTGVSHLASALRVPSVIVFLASDPLRWAPQDRRLHRAVRSVASIVASSNGNNGISNNGTNGVYFCHDRIRHGT
jgi:ADP-heptose:LPS heptosyltransferase